MAETDLWGGGGAAEHWAANQEKFRLELFNATLDGLGVGAGSTVFDAGCGTGGGARQAHLRGARVAGVDASPGMIAYAKKTIPDGDFRVADLERLPFENDTFDAVIAADSVQFAKDPVAALKELARVCKPAGRIAIATWDSPEKSDQSKVSRLLKDLAGGGGPNIFAVAEPGVMEDMLRRAGLTVTGGKSVPVPFRFRNFADYWSSTRTTATTKVAIAKSGEETVRAALAKLCDPLTGSDGAVVFKNAFRYVLAAR